MNENLLHAASTWLQRVGAPPEAVVVVGIAPRASVGAWVPGSATVPTLRQIDDSSAELLEAAGPPASEAMTAMDQEEREAVAAALARGACLQLLVAPAVLEVTLRLHDGVQVLTLAELLVEGWRVH